MALEAQVQQLQQQMQQMSNELQQSRQREQDLAARIGTMESSPGNLANVLQTLANTQTQVAEALKKGDKKMTLIDNRGIGKPEKFAGKEDESFLRWKIKLESFVLSVFPELEKVLCWSEEEDRPIDMDRVRTDFGPGTSEDIEGLGGKGSQLYSVLQNLLEGEAFMIIRNAPKGNGFEGWRRLNRRFDPATGAKKSSLLRHILNPEKSKLEELSERVEGWMELVNRYESRKGARWVKTNIAR